MSLLLAGCALRLAPPPAGEGWGFRLEGHFDDHVVELRGRLSRELDQVLDDGSLLWRIRFVDAEASAEGAPLPLSLAGRSLGVRAFDDGEILQLLDVDHVSDTQRHLDLFDPLIWALRPVLPSLEDGAEGRRVQRWPWRAPVGGWDGSLDATWARAGESWSWSGPFQARGAVGGVAVEALGEASGRLRLVEGEVQSHHVELRRTVRFGQERQEQVLVLDLQREAP